jgi:hypothetical protein
MYEDFINDLVNCQDSVILVLSDEGLNLKEISSLQITDVDFSSKTISLSNAKLKISDDSLKRIECAFNEEYYLFNNGEGEMERLIKSPFVVRGTSNEENVIYKRLEMFERLFGINLDEEVNGL